MALDLTDPATVGGMAGVATIVTVVIQGAVLLGRDWFRSRAGIEEAQIEANDNANARLREVLEGVIAELRDEVEQLRQELRETKEELAEKTDEWLLASRAHEDCNRRVSRLELMLKHLGHGGSAEGTQ